MHLTNLDYYRHTHVFYEIRDSDMRRVLFVVLLTFFMMIAEIVFGVLFNSMALLADGWHMATHASALGITLFTFYMVKRLKNDESYSFGTWKIEILGAYTSAILLAMVGIGVVYSSIERILHPAAIQYDHALIVSFIGLAVNVICAIVLNSGGHSHEHPQPHPHPHHDHEHEHHGAHEHGLGVKSAYLHVLADALTSVFAIVALFGAKLFNLDFLDPAMGIISSVLIFRWSIDLLRESSSILLDRSTDEELPREIRAIIEGDGDTKISDLHLWRVGQDRYACIISLVTNMPKKPQQYKKMLEPVHELVHISLEVVQCETNCAVPSAAGD